MAQVIRLCDRGELAEGSARGFDPFARGRDSMFIVRRNGIHAYANECPHWVDTPLPWRKDAYLNAGATRIVCSAHGAQFEIETGLCLLGPCAGRSLKRVPLIEGEDGSLNIEVTVQ